MVWQKSVKLAEDIFRVSQSFPREQLYVLASQMQRSALSVPSNIAEGRSRHSEKDFIYHLNIGRGSLAELETQITIACRLGFLSEKEKNIFFSKTEEITKMLHGLKTSLNKEKAKTYNLNPVN